MQTKSYQVVSLTSAGLACACPSEFDTSKYYRHVSIQTQALEQEVKDKPFSNHTHCPTQRSGR
jgi:hypothetical protein